MPETKRFFTPAEAKRTLPLVKKIVQDILQEGTALKAFADTFSGSLQDDPFVQEKLRIIQSYLLELEEIGCFYKDWNFTLGLVDFPAVLNNEEVLLCWRSDEDEILFYHSEADGYTGRKPIPDNYFTENN